MSHEVASIERDLRAIAEGMSRKALIEELVATAKRLDDTEDHVEELGRDIDLLSTAVDSHPAALERYDELLSDPTPGTPHQG